MRLQLVHDIKSLLTVSGSVSLEGLNLFLSGTANNLTPEQLGVYDNGNIKIVTITGADGQALNASSSDLEWLQGTITFDGSVYAQEQQLKDFSAYQEDNVHAAGASGSLAGLIVDFGIRLKDPGISPPKMITTENG